MACVKHFAGYGAAQGGRDYDSAEISQSELWNVYLPPFHAAEQAGAGTFMTSYMDLNGVPAAGSRWLMRDVLKGQWAFTGFIVSDWEAVHSLVVHGFAQNGADAATRAANAGLDMEMTSRLFQEHLASEVQAGRVPLAEIDDAVRRILRIKYELGLFSKPYVDVAASTGKLVTPEQRAASRSAGARTAVLLRNVGNLLPLKAGKGSIAVIGPLADSKVDITGSWALGSHSSDAVSVLDGIRARFAANPENVRYAKGVDIHREGTSIFDAQFPPQPVSFETDSERQQSFEAALNAARSSDVALLVLGESQNMNGERASRASLDLPGEQEKLLEAVVSTGKPVVLLLLNGRPLSIPWAAGHVPAILEGWYPGTEGGNALADVLFGDVNPGGKLPVTFPRSVGQEPLFYARNLTQIPHETDTMYWDSPSTPLYPFGYGLSYTTFSISNMRMATKTLSATQGQGTDVLVDVKNTGTRAGDEVVQLYTHQRFGSMSRPVRELKGFQRVAVGPGETKTVKLHLTADSLGFWSTQTGKWAVEPSTYDIWIANSSASSELHDLFTITQ